ncbi:MAG: DUF72 domain-containing protein [Deltaproteobacteria bacterium]|nr:DUF72 domain-containing protein [Deltaproteobacteria bacterium]
MPCRVYIGTSGYSYADWRGVFYPPSLAQSSFLEFYSRRFPCVELNYTYYRMPDAETLSRMEQKTPAGFIFTIKAHREMTHEIDDVKAVEICNLYLNALEPLARAGKLGCVLLQFPTSFHYTDANRRRLAKLLDMLSSLPLAVEFRGGDWLRDRVYTGLTKKNAAFVCVDEPALPGLIPPLEVVTADIGYVRFHGRNGENWWSGDSASRYDYRYTAAELGEWAPRLKKIASETEKAFVFMNNHWQGKAAEAAVMLKEILENEGLETA